MLRMSVPRISKEELKQRLEGEQGAPALQIVDVRLKYPYEHSTVKLPGALRIAADAIDSSQLRPNTEVVVYDSDPDEVTASHVASELARRGFRVQVLKGGISEWVAANLPVENKQSFRPAAPAPGTAKA
jgi:rhodanese-related sulfurtransferase